MSLLIESPAVYLPVTLAEVKAHLRLDSTSDDTMLNKLIIAAVEQAEKSTRRSLTFKGYACYFDKFPSPGQPIRIPSPPLITVESVKYLDAALDLQTWDAAEYFVANKQEPGLIVPKPGNVYPIAAAVPDSVEVHMHAGYSADGYGDETRPIPETIRLAIMQLAAHWYDHPETTSPDGQNVVPKNFADIFASNRIFVF